MGLYFAEFLIQRAIAHFCSVCSGSLAIALGLSLSLSAVVSPAISQTLDENLLSEFNEEENSETVSPVLLEGLYSSETGQFETDQMAQVTSVSQLADVSPGDWAYEALAYLANDEAQGGLDCLEGYPSGLYRGGQAMTRYEFAAGLAACLDAVTGRLEQLDPEAIARIEALQREFAAELATLGDRLDDLEAAVSELEANQFSTTLRFNTLASFNFSQSFAGGDILAEGITVPGVSPASRRPARQFDLQTGQFGDPVVETVRDDPSTTLSYSAYFVFTGSFQQTDELTMILAMGNGDPPASAFSSAGLPAVLASPTPIPTPLRRCRPIPSDYLS
ncbi:MAG: iron uptake porin [Cyanobacteriota bacterium]